jgi:hypothetical protein
MSTQHFTTLITDIAELDTELLSFSIDEQFCRENQIRLKSYKLFVHAVLENYFEQIALDLLSFALTEWKSSGKVNHVLMNLIAYAPISYSGNKKIDINERIRSITDDFRGKIRKNNGIKEESICKLFIPLGYKYSDFDSAWLATLDSYGKSRGHIAHKPISIQRPLEIHNEKQTVRIIVTGSNDIDDKYQAIIANINHPFLIS